MPDEPKTATPATRPHIPTQVAVLQGGPLHGRVVRVQTDHETVVMDVGGKQPPATYQRTTTDRPDGVAFNFVPAPKEDKPVA